ncbi:MAG: DegV family protein [Candidatus Pelethousia sp.]|nr:DegV family protein [Candidatus Pelethousia sp.]
MSHYKILADSCCDYVQQGEDVLSFVTRIPLTIELDGASFLDDSSLDCDLFLQAMAQSKNAPRSACPSPMLFAEACKGEATDIYIVTLSAKLSGTYSSACMGAEMIRKEYPHKRIHVFNSRSAACAEVAICLRVKELAESGLPFEEVVARGEAFVHEMTTDFVLEDLEVFRKSGRLNHLQALAVSALHIKMVMGADSEGGIVVRAKAIGINRALAALVENVKSIYNAKPCPERTLVITYCACLERAEEICKRILAVCPFAKSLICKSSGISTMYANAGGIIVAF